MSIQISTLERNPQKIVNAVRQLVEGRGDNVGDVTLAANAVVTVVSFENCSKDCRVFLMPQTANAAAALSATYIMRAEILQKQFIIRHASAATLDRTFSFLCIGG